jgi:MFS family permease
MPRSSSIGGFGPTKDKPLNQLTLASTTPSTKWWILAFLSLATLGNYYVYDAVGPLADQLSTELGYTDVQIGSLNAVYSLPNIFLVLIGGLLVDKFGAGLIALWTSAICLTGAAINASTGAYEWMVVGRFLFGIGAETLLVAVTVAIGIWFGRHMVAFALALSLSLGRLGSYAADLSPVWLGNLYEQGWQGPMIVSAGFATLSMLATVAFWWLDRSRQVPAIADSPAADKFHWKDVFKFNRSFWYILALCVLFYSVIFPFRSTFAIKYFQHVHEQSLESAALLNSHVFLAAVIFTPLFGWTADRYGHRALQMVFGSLLLPLSFLGLMSEDWGLWLTSVLLGISYSLVPAILWPAVTKLVAAERLGSAYGLLFMMQAVGLTVINLVAGSLNDVYGASADNPAGYTPMLILFGLLAIGALVFSIALWRRESGPHGSGMELPG